MKFSYKFLVSTLLILVIFVFMNVIALKHYASVNFGLYLSEVKTQTADIDIAFIENILQNKKIDPELLNEYKEITKDLGKISSTLETYSKDPRPTNNVGLLESLQKSGISPTTIEQIIGTNALQSFFGNILNLFDLDSNTPEGKFILNTLKSMAYFNLIILSIIFILSYFWVNYSFRPVRAIIDNLSNVIYKKEYRNIVYKKKDEFFPLIEAINNLNKSLSIQEKIRSDFLSDLSHEIKTPITAIKCYLEGIEDGVIKTDEKNMKILYEEIERLIKITNSIMEIEKEESRNFGDIFLEKVNYTEMVEKVIEEYTPLLLKNNQEAVSFVPNRFFINVDKDKFTQLLHNIFSNFIKYAGKETCLTVKVINKVNQIVLIFSDNGKGVQDEELPYIKEKFYKVDKVRNKNKDSGIGIGISVLEKIIKLHNGTMEINSGLKKGFEVVLRLPK